MGVLEQKAWNKDICRSEEVKRKIFCISCHGKTTAGNRNKWTAKFNADILFKKQENGGNELWH